MKPLLFGLEPHASLLEALSTELDIPRGKATIDSFPDGERQVRLRESVAGRTLILVGSTGPPVDSHLMTMALLADAARRGGSRDIIAVLPYFGYSRSERMADPGTPIGARLAADLLQASGIRQLITLDLHSSAIPGFFTIPLLEETATQLLAEAFMPAQPETRVVVSPDTGGIKRASRFATLLGVPLAVSVKHREVADAPKILHLWGDVAGREALLFDDMITTGGTLEAVGRLLWERDVKAIDVAATHAVMAPGARERLRSLGVRRLVTTDSIPHETPDWEVRSIAPLLAPVIARSLGGPS